MNCLKFIKTFKQNINNITNECTRYLFDMAGGGQTLYKEMCSWSDWVVLVWGGLGWGGYRLADWKGRGQAGTCR